MANRMRVEVKEEEAERISIVGNWKNWNVLSCPVTIQTYLCAKHWLQDWN